MLGTRYSIFYIDNPLYSGEWTVGEAASGSGGDAVREVAPDILVLADAYNDSMKHNLQRYTDAEGKILIKNPQAVDIRDH